MVSMGHHHDFPNPDLGSDSTLLFVPAWNHGIEGVVRIVNFKP